MATEEIDRPLEIYEENGRAVARRARTGDVVPFPGGGGDPLQVGEMVAMYLQTHPPAGGISATFRDVAIPMYQTGCLPAGDRRPLSYGLARPTLKLVAQELYIPGALAWYQYILVMDQSFIDGIPDIDVAVGGQFEWELPRGHRLPRPGEPDLRGYFTFPCGIGYADHPRTMPGVGMIRTEAPNKCIAYLRVDMFVQMLQSIINKDRLYGEEWGALNRRRPWGKWTPGSWIKWTAIYPAE